MQFLSDISELVAVKKFTKTPLIVCQWYCRICDVGGGETPEKNNPAQEVNLYQELVISRYLYLPIPLADYLWCISAEPSQWLNKSYNNIIHTMSSKPGILAQGSLNSKNNIAYKYMYIFLHSKVSIIHNITTLKQQWLLMIFGWKLVGLGMTICQLQVKSEFRQVYYQYIID